MNHSYQQEDPPPEHSTHYHDPNSFQPLYNRHTDPNTERWSETAGNHQSQQPIPNQSLHARYGQTTANHHPGISQPQFNLSQADRYTAQGVTPVNIQGTAAPTTGQTTANHHPGRSQPQFNPSQADRDRYTAQGVTPVNIQGTAAPTTFPRGPAQGQGLADTDTYPEDRSNTGIHPGPYEARTQSAHLQQAHLPLSRGTPATPLRPDQLTNAPPPPVPHPPLVDPLGTPARTPATNIGQASGGAQTRKPKRSAEEMRIAQVVAAEKRARRFEMQAERAAEARQKQATNAAKKLIKAQKAASTTPRPTWTEEQTLELLNYVRMVKEDHSQTRVTGGFIPFGKYFAAYTGRAEAFPLLESISTATRINRSPDSVVSL
ncbi:hypothetical protein PGTUg99_007039 [Puccinia graminis f. sp. tritici]|uniref:Uncharacterized protein n=1 Tax=Puccinia graminis f. sp. tritici TaxID=56615 RepID=A0A5B0SAQ9_PUCGR|nr:hypothetical protein PGTUg99_007039 [Puccinia graminis f. sp. tritici]